MNGFFTLDRLIDAFPQIISYLNISLEFFVICTIWTAIFSIIVAALRIKKIPVIQHLLGVYVSYMRGTPFLVQMMVVYYGLPMLILKLFGININRWDAIIFAEIALIMNESAFLGEIIKGAILSISPVQSEAGYSIGMTKMQTFFHIVLPQTIRVVIPSYGISVVGIFQNTSMLYMVGVIDMMARAKSINGITGHSLEAYTVIAIIYIVFSLIMKLLFNIAENKTNYERR